MVQMTVLKMVVQTAVTMVMTMVEMMGVKMDEQQVEM